MARQSRIACIRFQKTSKVYHFDASHIPDLAADEFVVVDTARGVQLGQVVQVMLETPNSPDGLKHIGRRASSQDLVLRQHWKRQETEAAAACRAKALELNIRDVKFVDAEFSFDGARLAILYSNESGEKMEFKNLRKVMQRLYPQSQVEFHLIGPRDVAKLLGGMGACGLESRCCTAFLNDFSPVSIKMAKEQGISLTPTEITGMCGRLRCCLVYEYEQYVEARKQLPKRNKRVNTPQGEGKVWDVLPLKDAVIVEFETGARAEFTRLEIQPAEELEALKKKAETACDRHPEGGCDCLKKGKKKRNDESPSADTPA